MTLLPGARLGPYEVLGLLGAGGMGEVYRARDTRLGRAVAVKVLKALVAEDEGRRRRFEEEARAAGALNHPNVLAVYDVGRENGVLYVVSELLEGQTLRDRLDGPLPIRKATDYGIQIAHGLAAAHAKGIVHRDLKPENLFLTPDGHVKILDFGLARRDATPSDDGETASARGLETDPGTILGTVSYMSPEQVRGQRVDHRSDLFSFGVVLYEMLAGGRPFKGATAADTTSAILKEEAPDLLTERPDLNPALERIVRRCLEKEASGRFQSAQDLAFALQTVSGSGVTHSAATTMSALRRGRRTVGMVALTLAALLAASAGVSIIRRGPPTADLSAYRFTPLATEPWYEGSVVWSADGQNVAYLGEKNGVLQVFTRGLGASTSAQITHSLRDCKEPFWSADGRRVFYVSLAGESEGLWSVGAAGGAPELMLHNVSAAALSRDGRTLFLLREETRQGEFLQALWTSSPAGKEPVRYAESPLADKRFARGFLRMAPDGRKLGLWAAATSDEHAGEAGYANPEFWIVPAAGGPPFRVLEALPRMPDPAPFSWMPDSRHIVFAAEFRDTSPGTHLWWADTVSGRSWPLTATSGSEHYPSVSPDGRRLAFTEHEEDYDLVAVPLDGGPLQTVLSTSRTEADPAWSPVGDQYAYVTNRARRDEIWMRSRDGTLERPLVTAASFQGSETFLLGALAFSPDGQRLAYQRRGPAGFRIWISAVAGGPAVQLAIDDSYQDAPTWSPDGEWIAFVFRRQTQWGLAKARVGGGSEAVVLMEGIVYPSNPRWSPTGDWITCDTREGFSVISTKDGRARVLSEDTPLAHAWSRDGGRIFAVRPADGGRLELVAIELATGAETVVVRDLGASPPSDDPLRGFSLAPDGKSFLTSILRLRGDLWILEGFEPRPWGLAERLFGRS